MLLQYLWRRTYHFTKMEKRIRHSIVHLFLRFCYSSETFIWLFWLWWSITSNFQITIYNQYLSLSFFQQLLDGHFDTNVGAKTEKSSYGTIAKSINQTPSSILFLTDIPKGLVFKKLKKFKFIEIYFYRSNRRSSS